MKYAPFFLALLLILSPTLTSAATFGGFVTCEGSGCSACNLVDMINKIIFWLFGAVFVIFAVLMAVAGFGLVTSGGNQSALDAAKSKFQNAIIGIIIIMSAWLIVDTVMKGLLAGGTGSIAGFGPWAEVQCQVQAEPLPFTDLNTGQGGSPTVTGQGQVASSTIAGTCSVRPLSPLMTPQAIMMEKGQTVIFESPVLQQCAQKFVAAVGGGARINSAFRPQEYQTHLWEIRDRWCDQKLRTNTDASCSSLKTAIGAEVNKHFGSSWSCGAVAKGNSNHAKSTAVDIGGIPSHSAPAVQQAAANNCLVWKNFPGDPWHYELKPGCTCN
jgi:hypothetical protein